MVTKLLALSVGVAMLGGVEIAGAETKMLEPAVTTSNPQIENTKNGNFHHPGPLLLTDSQMDVVTAGHTEPRTVNSERHKGWYWGRFNLPQEGYHKTIITQDNRWVSIPCSPPPHGC